MKKYGVKITGVTPYMQHRMDDAKLENWEKNRKFIIERDDISKEDFVRAEFHAYKDEEKGKYFIPADHIMGAMVGAGSLHKGKMGNAKRSMKNIVCGMFQVMPEKLYLENGFLIDKRSAVNHHTKDRVITIRPKWNDWKAEFEIWVDNDTITDETVKSIVTDAGNYLGIGSFRPQKGGRFGRYRVDDFQKLNGA